MLSRGPGAPQDQILPTALLLTLQMNAFHVHTPHIYRLLHCNELTPVFGQISTSLPAHGRGAGLRPTKNFRTSELRTLSHTRLHFYGNQFRCPLSTSFSIWRWVCISDFSQKSHYFWVSVTGEHVLGNFSGAGVWKGNSLARRKEKERKGEGGRIHLQKQQAVLDFLPLQIRDGLHTW